MVKKREKRARKLPQEKAPTVTDVQTEEEAKFNAILEAKVAQAASKVLADLPQAINNAVQNEVKTVRDELKGQLDTSVNEIKQLIITGKAEAPNSTAVLAAPGVVGAPAGPAPSDNGQLANLAQIAQAITMFMGGNKPGGGVKEAIGQVIEFQNMAAALWQNPFEAAMRTLVTTLKGGYSVGKSTEELTDGLERAAKEQKSATDIFKVGGDGKPSA